MTSNLRSFRKATQWSGAITGKVPLPFSTYLTTHLMKTFEQQTAYNKSLMLLQQFCLGKESLNPLRITRNCENKVQNFPHLMQVMYRYVYTGTSVHKGL